MTTDVSLDDIVERSTRRYLVTKVLNLWEVSMGTSYIRKKLNDFKNYGFLPDFLIIFNTYS
jgi:hypothetical protein